MGDLVNNLIEIEEYKNKIKEELVKKGFDNMDDVPFSGYAAKIAELQLNTTPPSGSSPAPTPSADYIYSNGYVEGGYTNEITNLIPYEINVDGERKFEIELVCPAELYGREDDNGNILYYDIIFTFDVPATYTVDKFEFYNPIGSGSYVTRPYKKNPKYTNDGKVYRNGIEYISYVRQTSDNLDCYSDDVQGAPLKYRITIIKN